MEVAILSTLMVGHAGTNDNQEVAAARGMR